ncbi:MAG: hypothetical protein E7659_06300 [Ruminococcaceae bacterium]|nr:hypothetical protein [Oscillospiraceae bacterium]
MKKNVMMRVASALLVAVLMTTCAISGTFAKYTTSATATDSARVAKWDVKINGSTANNSNTFTFNLFETINDTTGGAEGDINPADGTIIAPGTQGSFEIVLKNDSEVTAEYVIDYTVTNTANIPVVFSLNGTDWKNSIDELDVTTPVNLAIGATAPTITVHWMWAFEGGNDNHDTYLGLDGSATLKVDAKVTVTQVN